MDDRFKFRNWDEHDKCMVYDMYDWRVGWLDSDHIMQCTGLKDKNGKLIYEGDILTYGPKDCIWVVQYDKENACFYSPPWGELDPNLSAFSWKEAEIIGNCYEHLKWIWNINGDPCFTVRCSANPPNQLIRFLMKHLLGIHMEIIK